MPVGKSGLTRADGGYDPSQFRALAELEDGHFWFEGRVRLILWALNTWFPNAQSLLEVGCGTGHVLAGLRDFAPDASLVAGDYFLEALNIACRRVPEAVFIQMDARNLPFRQSFDVVAAFDVLEHIDDDERVLAEMFSIVRPGGGLLLTVPQHPSLWSQMDSLARHRRRYTRSELIRKTRNAGFNVLRATSFVTLLFPAMMMSRIAGAIRPLGDRLPELHIPRGANAVADRLMTLERLAIRAGLTLPFGGSLLLVASRPASAV